MPERIETTLLVVEEFKDASGMEWRAGDRAPLSRRAVRLAALERPELFAVEFGTEPVDVERIRELHDGYEAAFRQAKRAQDERQKQAQREELEDQKAADRDSAKLEGRYAKQERERAKREAEAREERERVALEAGIGPLTTSGRSGFNFEEE
jgi:hypothetical protein